MDKTQRFNDSVSDDEEISECEEEKDEYEDESAEYARRPKRNIAFKNEVVNIVCTWHKCGERFYIYEPFVEHISDHVKATKSEDDVLRCGFTLCEFQTTLPDVLEKHAAVHARWECLKSIGQNVVDRLKLPECSNVVNEITFSLDYRCKWTNCKRELQTFHAFVEHVNEAHIAKLPIFKKAGEEIRCGWHGCNSKFNTERKVKLHMRMHTGEKLLACPTCGCSFSSKSRFVDHRKRQLPIELCRYKCSECSKLFSTERLLRDHMRLHINHYKCTMCDMTCSRPAILAAHIRFRHINERPYKCSLCNHATVTKAHLEQHLTTHCADNLMACEHCDFSCRSIYGLERHIQKEHGEGATALYSCHCCERFFSRGGHLTRHLLNRHNFNWPSGHSRFSYKQCPDGYFRLKTVRYESLEVTQEMMKEKLPAIDTSQYDISMKRDESGRIPSFILTLKASKSEDEEDDVDEDKLVIDT